MAAQDRVEHLASKEAASGNFPSDAGTEFVLDDAKNELQIQIDISGGANVSVEGKMSSKLQWQTVVASTSISKVTVIAWMPHLRAVISAGSPIPSVNVAVHRGR